MSHEINIRKVLSIINKDLGKFGKSDIDNCFSSFKGAGTRELAKIKFKSFLRFHNLNELADHIKINSN